MNCNHKLQMEMAVVDRPQGRKRIQIWCTSDEEMMLLSTGQIDPK